LDQLLALRVFVRIADAGSFAKAADSLNLPRSSVSKLLQDLEQHLGTKLVERSTRALTITPEGEAYRDQALDLLANLDEMDLAARDARVKPRGRLRVDVGSSLANMIIVPALPDFRRRYPDLELLLWVHRSSSSDQTSTFEPQRLDEKSERSRVLASPRIIQVIARKGLAPVLKNHDQTAILDVLGNLAFERIGKRKPIQRS
jgi:molybdenum-dependent DNA-binding transcriptional regulator ModE